MNYEGTNYPINFDPYSAGEMDEAHEVEEWPDTMGEY